MRTEFLPYCLPWIGEEEIAEVVDSLRNGWLTTGPKVQRFEKDFAEYVGARHAIAVNSCTAALHVSLAALGIGPGDEVIVPTLTFCATANVALQLGAKPVLVDVDENFLMDPEVAEKAITPRTRAILPVHYGGQACDMDRLLDLGRRHGIAVVEDAAHAAGSEYRGRKIGSHGDAVCFSFYATKNLTTGEGGMIATAHEALAAHMRRLALHGMSHDAWKRYTKAGSWYYEVVEAGFKYNMSDLQAAIGIHQLRRLDDFTKARRAIAGRYKEAFAELPELILPPELPDRLHVFHLYPVRLRSSAGIRREAFIEELKRRNIGTSVHFIPLHRHPLYRDASISPKRRFPIAERIYEGLVSLPLYPKMSGQDIEDVISAVTDVLRSHSGRALSSRVA